MIKAILSDMDNTLIENQYLYDEATAMLCGYMCAFGISITDTKDVFIKTDKELFKTLGYSRERMPAAFEATLKHFKPDATADMIKTARELAETIFTTVARSKPGAQEAVDILSENYPIYIVTAGPRDVQEFRFENLPFGDKIAGVYIVDKKDKQTYLDIIEDLGLKAEDIVMIGDSLKSDVIAPVQAGTEAVWIEEHNSVFEHAEGFPASGAYKFSSLLEAARHIVKHGSPAPIADTTPRQTIKPPKFGT